MCRGSSGASARLTAAIPSFSGRDPAAPNRLDQSRCGVSQNSASQSSSRPARRGRVWGRPAASALGRSPLRHRVPATCHARAGQGSFSNGRNHTTKYPGAWLPRNRRRLRFSSTSLLATSPSFTGARSRAGRRLQPTITAAVAARVAPRSMTAHQLTVGRVAAVTRRAILETTSRVVRHWWLHAEPLGIPGRRRPDRGRPRRPHNTLARDACRPADRDGRAF